MTVNCIKNLCRDLGSVEKFSENTSAFGNMDLEIITPNRTKLYVVSDRGEILCYVKKKMFFTEKLIPINQILNMPNTVTFATLIEAINYLKTYLDMIEAKGGRRTERTGDGSVS